MSTNPKELPDAFGNVKDWQFGYFNECMSGFEHQAASHMIAESLVHWKAWPSPAPFTTATTRARRNPYNEIECSDHYSRAMASYGSYITACGFEAHGPNGHLAFAPRWQSENFRAAFTSAQGWGTFAQKKQGKSLTAEIILRHGKLNLNTLALEGHYIKATAKHSSKTLPATVATQDGKVVITLAKSLVLNVGETLTVVLS